MEKKAGGGSDLLSFLSSSSSFASVPFLLSPPFLTQTHKSYSTNTNEILRKKNKKKRNETRTRLADNTHKKTFFEKKKN